MIKKLLRGILALICCIFLSSQIYAQDKTIVGTITSGKDNTPIGLATVSVKGTKIAVATAANGSFSITVPQGKNTLVVSSVGYGEEEINISDKSTISLALKESTSALNEVVVTGYSSQRKKDITGSVAIVNVKDLKAVPAGSPEQMLQGRASGLNIITSGQPGSGSNIRIRGITSFGNTDPLVPRCL